MDINKDKQTLDDVISSYEAEIKSLKHQKQEDCQKIEQLENLQKSYSEIINSLTIPTLTGNNKGQIIGANDQALKLTQLTIEELLQKNIKDIILNQDLSGLLPKKRGKEKIEKISSEQILVKKMVKNYL